MLVICGHCACWGIHPWLCEVVEGDDVQAEHDFSPAHDVHHCLLHIIISNKFIEPCMSALVCTMTALLPMRLNKGPEARALAWSQALC